MVASGQAIPYVADALGISENLIYTWKSKNKLGKENSGQHSDLAIENQQLKNQVRQLESERDILKKALSIFSGAAPAERTDGALRVDRLFVRPILRQHAVFGVGSQSHGLLPLQERRQLSSLGRKGRKKAPSGERVWRTQAQVRKSADRH